MAKINDLRRILQDKKSASQNDAQNELTEKTSPKNDYNTTARENVERHLRILFENFEHGYINLRHFETQESKKDKKPVQNEFYEISADNFEKIARKVATKPDWFVGVHPRSQQSGAGDEVIGCKFLFADFDPVEKEVLPDLPNIEEVVEQFKTLGVEPRLIVSTGRGLHCYFELQEQVSKESFKTYEETLLWYLREHFELKEFELDLKVRDLARILRLAGTKNSKNDKFVEIVYESDSTIPLSTIEHLTQIYHRALYKTEARDLASTIEKQTFAVKLATACQKAFHEGQRQFITIYYAGALALAGYTEEEAIQHYEQYLEPLDDPKEKRMRIAGIKHTYKRFANKQPILGLKGLEKLGVSIEEATSTSDFVIIGDYVHARKGEKLVPIGPAVKITAHLIDKEANTFKYEVSYNGLKRTDLNLTKDDIRSFTKEFIFDSRLYEQYLYSQTQWAKKLGSKLVIKRTGWFDDRLVFFNDENEDLYFEVSPEIANRFVTISPDKQLELIKGALKEGNELAIVYIVSFSSILLHKLMLPGYTLVITGPRGVGKTTLAKLGINLFYDARKKFTMDATPTAIERLAYTLTDLPLLLDELALIKDQDEFEKLVFKLEGGSTKARSNKSLEVKQDELRNVLITTNEFELSFAREGAVRRALVLTVSQTPHIPNVVEAQNWIGAGREIAKFFERNCRDLLNTISSKYSRYSTTKHYYALALWGALEIFENYFGESFEASRQALNQFLEKHEEEIGDYFEKKYAQLREYLIRNKHKFLEIDRSSTYSITEQINFLKQRKHSEIFGIVVYEENFAHILILPRTFETILEDLAISRKSFLKELADRGILVTNSKAFLYRIRTAHTQNSLYSFFCLGELHIEAEYFYYLKWPRNTEEEEPNEDEPPF